MQPTSRPSTPGTLGTSAACLWTPTELCRWGPPSCLPCWPCAVGEHKPQPHPLAQIGSQGLTHAELTLVGTMAGEGRAIMVAVNKFDLLDSSARKQVQPGPAGTSAGTASQLKTSRLPGAHLPAAAQIAQQPHGQGRPAQP